MPAHPALVLALALGASGCGGIAVIESEASDGGATQTASTASESSSTATASVAMTSTSEVGLADGGGVDGPPSCMISASNYDQSCTFDGDCTLVFAGNYCTAECTCLNSTINVAAFAQYYADVGKTPLGSGAIAPLVCFCLPEEVPCCLQGGCSTACT